MEIPEELLCLFSGPIEETDDSYVIEVPKYELDDGDLAVDEVYRIALLASASSGNHAENRDSETVDGSSSKQSSEGAAGSFQSGYPDPPVEEGEIREVEVDSIGDKGDGIARIEHGYIVFVPDTIVGDTVRIRIDNVTENFAFSEIVERDPSSPDVDQDSPFSADE